MDPAAELFAAWDARSADPERFERAVAGVRHLLRRAAAAVVGGRPDLLKAAKVELDDVVQELTHKLFRDPPTTRGRAEAVIVGWAKVVARNHLLDLGARARRELPLEAAPERSSEADPERSFDAKTAMRRLEHCAEELGDRYRATYLLLREDAEISRLELARRLDMVSAEDADAAVTTSVDPKSALGDRLRRAQANAWAIVSRVRARLAQCLDRHGMLEILPETLSKLRARRSHS